MNKLQWGEGVVEEGFSRDDVCAASWEIPRSLPDKEHEWGVTHLHGQRSLAGYNQGGSKRVGHNLETK